MRNFNFHLIVSYKRCFNVGTKEAFIKSKHRFIGYHNDKDLLIKEYLLSKGIESNTINFEFAKDKILKNSLSYKGFYFYNF